MFDDQTKFELPDEQIYSVSELLSGIKINLEDIYYDIQVEGELSSYKRQAGSGHSYLSLSDEKSKIDAVMFRHKNIYLTFKPVAGMNVLCRGKVTVYPPTGKMQLQVEHMEETGIGSASKAFRELAEGKAELDSFDIVEGLMLEGAKNVEVLNGISLHGALAASWPRAKSRWDDQ